jgi:uncharacterized protein (TIGR03435 family)
MRPFLLTSAACLAIFNITGVAQTPDSAFDIATIKRYTPTNGVSAGAYYYPQRFTGVGTLRDFIQIAYDFPADRVAGGPPWLDSERFEIDGRTSVKVPPQRLMTMLQSLLTDRFALHVHRESRELPVYDLITLHNGLKIHPLADAAKPGGITSGRSLLRGQMTLADLARALSPTLGRPVIDRTGQTAKFEIKLQWSPDDSPGSTQPSIFTALQEQLGLKLQSTKGPVDVMVIDHANKPSAN